MYLCNREPQILFNHNQFHIIMRNYFLPFLAAVVLLILTTVSCSDTETVDDTSFALFYPDLTDIGPSMSANVSALSYIGATPSEFALTGVTLKDEPISTTSFTIDPETGSIAIRNTETLAVGVYRLSISCTAGGQSYNFPNLVAINMMAPVPDGIKVEPDKLTIDYADLKTTKEKAQVVTDGTHVSISEYRIAEGEHKDYFAVSATGEISINKKYEGEILPGLYKVSLVLKTAAGEGIFPDAVTIHITSKPLALTYTPAKTKIEAESLSGTSYVTPAPVLKGSLDEAAYSIAQITPATDKIKIDPATGVLSIAEGHGFKAGETYVVDVNVRNKYNTPDETGTVMEAAFTLEVVGYIRPIEKFAYDNQTKVQATPFSIKHTDTFIGDEVTFTFGQLAANLQGQLSIDPATGTISAVKGNKIPLGQHTLIVKATNVKGEQTAFFTLTIEKNKNFFTTIKYGNNLGLPLEGNAYQYRLQSAAELKAFTVAAPQTDIPQGATTKWEINNDMNADKITIDPNSGALSFAEATWKDAVCGMATITATVGTGDEAVSVSTPIFLHFAAPKAGVTINYTPFVCRINPKTGGRTNAPQVEGIADKSKLLMDYRRGFNYVNINGSESHVSGKVTNDAEFEHLFLAQVWRNYFTAVDKKPNYAGRAQMSYYDNQSTPSVALGYVNPADLSIIINPGKWIGEDKVYANGVMSGEITFVTNGDDKLIAGSKNTITPLLIWMDEKF